MPIIKNCSKLDNFVMIENDLLNNTQLSWKAKGLLCCLLSLPRDWDARVVDLIKRSTDGRDSIYSALEELRKHGYVACIKVRTKTGRFDKTEYHVFARPEYNSHFSGSVRDLGGRSDASPDPVNPDHGSPDREFPEAEIPSLINKEDTKKNKNKKTAAIADAKNSNNSHTEKNFVAAFFSKDDVIGNELTAGQTQQVLQAARSFAKHVGIGEPKTLANQICHTLLNKHSYSNAGQDFKKKLNTVKKAIRNGTWTSPVEQFIAQKKKQDDDLLKLTRELENAREALAQWEVMVANHLDQNPGDSARQFELAIESFRKEEQQALLNLQAYEDTRNKVVEYTNL